ncbi:uncharacterized protein LOC105829405 [Monomorium pharaonis]|uniref:uncharacterized protein LOC105829405 n=1 Tax=Monomorium pharaonis TaxID=307658 RepID=UPI00063EE4C0|nr:uncharacterized protein LOC105829405 [Monomorium pharaonis]XP_036142335.1 uncharacterized protein LOC105829405 [Monomorium pharaonis]
MTETTMASNRTTYDETTAGKLNLTSVTFLPSNVVAAAFNAETTNPSAAMTGDPAAVTTIKPHLRVHNVTEYLVEQDELDHSILANFSDIQTVLLACISTLLPLIIALGIAFGCRHVWRKYRNDGGNGLPWYKNVCNRDNAVESQNHHPHSGNVPVEAATRVLSAQDLVNGLDVPRYMCETEVMEDVNVAPTAAVMKYTTTTTTSTAITSGNHISKNANGNIITLTLKNNHLIVETEERAVTMEDDKSTSRYKDSGSFVVEVQPDYDKEEMEGNKGSSDNVTTGVTDQQALVHREEIPDDRSSGFENTRLFGSTNTGLSQSDLSISSQGSANPSYRYGNQVEYDSGHLGYPMYGGSYESDMPLRKLEGRSKWVEFDKSPDIEKILLDDSRNFTSEEEVEEEEGEQQEEGQEEDNKSLQFFEKSKNLSSLQDMVNAMREDSLEMDSFPDPVRSNPNLQVNGTTPNKLEIMEQKALSNDFASKVENNKPVITGVLLKDDVQEDAFQEQQRKLGNGTLTPEHKGDRTAARKPEGSVFVPSHKRAGSIPPRLIEETLEMERKKSLDLYNKYSQIKTSTRGMLPSLSPKFELLQNEVSPIEEKES